MRYYRRSRLRSSRGHVRVEQGPAWTWWAAGIGGIVALIVVVAVVVSQFALPHDKNDKTPGDNRSWLEFALTDSPVNRDSVRQLAARLKDNQINTVYLESAAWLTDGSLREGAYAQAFADALRDADSDLKVLLWLRMSASQIADPNAQALALDLAGKAVREWGFDGAQLQGRAVEDGSESFTKMVRDLRGAIGSDAVLSVTVPPDRIPADPDVPLGSTVAPELTWTLNYKQRIGLLGADEIVIMAHASGLSDAQKYQAWVAYQIETYTAAMAELDRPPDIIVALPTYDAEPDHDPAVENIPSAVQGVKQGLEQVGKNGELVKGVGLYAYSTTDSLEWALYAEYWMGRKPE